MIWSVKMWRVVAYVLEQSSTQHLGDESSPMDVATRRFTPGVFWPPFSIKLKGLRLFLQAFTLLQLHTLAKASIPPHIS